MITIVSGHHPSTTYYAIKTRKSIQRYCSLNKYNFYYDDEPAIETERHHLHFKRCESLRKASETYPNSTWYVWLDSDVYVNKYSLKIEKCIDLSEPMLYHLFHEKPWGCYPINTGVKFVHRDAIQYEKEIWSLRNTDPWNKFPFEQKTTYEYILPKIAGQYKIHSPHVLNCIIKAYPSLVSRALFVHMCAMSTDERNKHMSKILII